MIETLKCLINRYRQVNLNVVLVVITAVTYLPFLGNAFFFDDLSFFLSGAPAYYVQKTFNFELRWFPYASLGWTAEFFSDAMPHFFHLGNVLLHLGNSILVYELFRKITGLLVPQAAAQQIKQGAWLGAAVFAVHPVAVYAAGYVVQRSILMATFFGLLMFWAYLRGAVSGDKRWLVLSVVFYFIACFSKEHSVLLLLVLAALVILLRDHNKLDKKEMAFVWIAYFVVSVSVVLRAKGVFGLPYEPMSAQLFEQQGIVASTPILHLQSIMTQAGLFFKYLFLWLVPNPAWMSIDMREQFIMTWKAWQGWAGIVAFVAYGAVAMCWLWHRGSKGLLGFALLYPWLLYLIEFSSIRVQEPFVLYRSYLWMPGLMLLVPLMMLHFSGRNTFKILFWIVLLLIPLSWNRLWIFADNFRMWNDAAVLLSDERVAGADRIYFNRGQALTKNSQWDAAAKDFARAAIISPKLAPVQFELANAYAHLDRYQDALVSLNAAIQIDPTRAVYYYYKGISLKHLHQYAASQDQMRNACELKYIYACLWISAPLPQK
jgi:hypothetical protein